jgi:hypothetical protein
LHVRVHNDSTHIRGAPTKSNRWLAVAGSLCTSPRKKVSCEIIIRPEAGADMAKTFAWPG